MDNTKIKTFIKSVVSSFKKVTPDWSPPHKTIYNEARKLNMKAVIDGHDEKAFDKTWLKRFEDGALEDDVIKVKLVDGASNIIVRFRSNDLREIHTV